MNRSIRRSESGFRPQPGCAAECSAFCTQMPIAFASLRHEMTTETSTGSAICSTFSEGKDLLGRKENKNRFHAAARNACAGSKLATVA